MQVIPMLRYVDAPRAIAFLCTAFGCKRLNVVELLDGTVPHGELKLGDTVLFVASLTPQRRAGGFRTPKEAGGFTQGLYVSVPDLDAHFAQAKACGAEIVQEPKDEPQGRGYVAKDLEGHLWGFGTYAPVG